MKTKIIARGAMVSGTILIGAAIIFLGTYGARGCPRRSFRSVGSNEMPTTDYFSSSHQAARQMFLDAAQYKLAQQHLGLVRLAATIPKDFAYPGGFGVGIARMPSGDTWRRVSTGSRCASTETSLNI